MSLQPFLIGPVKDGIRTDLKPFAIPDDAFEELINAYQFRGRVLRRIGYSLLGRLRLDETLNSSLVGLGFINLFTVLGLSPPSIFITGITQASQAVVSYTVVAGTPVYANGNRVFINNVVGMTQINNGYYTVVSTGVGTLTLNVDSTSFTAWSSGGTISLESSASIIPGTVTLTVGANTYTDSNGILTGVPGGSGTINYLTGLVNIVGGGVSAITGTFSYYPGLPVMANAKRDLLSTNLNSQNLISFDTKYSYLWDTGANKFKLLPSTMPVTWSGENYNLFYTVNYSNSFWATNSTKGLHYFEIDVATGFTGTNGLAGLSATVDVTLAAGNTAALNDYVYFYGIDSGSAAKTNNLMYGQITAVVTPGIKFTITSLDPDGIAFANGTVSTGKMMDANQSLPGYDGIRYYISPTNTTWVNYNPPISSTTALAGALLMFAYKGYFVFLNTWEGTDNANLNNYRQRARWTQVGSPYYSNPVPSGAGVNPKVMRSDLFQGAGQIDAPTSESIIGAAFIRDVLVVYFQYSTWRLRFQQSSLQPFVWDRINVELGSQSTFSSIPFDKTLIALGNRGIVATDANDTKRIDSKIPDYVFDFSQANNGPNRVAGIRTFRTRLAYWAYPFTEDYTPIFNNRVLVYNYDTQNFATFKDSYTCFGYFLPSSEKTWGDLKNPWASYIDESAQSGSAGAFYETVLAGNQQGFVLEIEDGHCDNEESLAVYGISDSSVTLLPTVFTSNNHNLEVDDWIELTGVIGSTSADGVSLNNRNYKVISCDINTFTLGEFQSLMIGSVTTPWTGFTYKLDVPYIPIYPFSVQINVGGIEFTDINGDGILISNTAGASGQIFYNTGVLTLRFTTPLGVDTPVYCRVVANQPIQPITTVGTYIGGGLITIIPNFSIKSKYFNFFPKAQKTRFHYIDFYMQQTSNGEFTCDMLGDGTETLKINTPLPDNPRSDVVETKQNPYQVYDSNTTIYRLYCESQASTLQLDLNLDDQQMAVDIINSSGIEIQAMIIHGRESGRLI